LEEDLKNDFAISAITDRYARKDKWKHNTTDLLSKLALRNTSLTDFIGKSYSKKAKKKTIQDDIIVRQVDLKPEVEGSALGLLEYTQIKYYRYEFYISENAT